MLTAQKKRELKKAKKAAKKAAKERRRKERAEAELRSKMARRRSVSCISAKSTPLPPELLRRMKKRSNSFDGGSTPISMNSSYDQNNEYLKGRPICEEEYVRKVYDSIALQWHGTRYKPWPKVAKFIERQPKDLYLQILVVGTGKIGRPAPTCAVDTV